MLEFVSMYSRQFNDVNEDIVCHIREKDDMTQYIEEACKELQKALPSNITYLSFYYDDSGKRMREINKAKAKKGGKDTGGHAKEARFKVL